MTLKIAVVGCGQIADGHVEEISKMPNALVISVCDLEILMAEQIATRFSIPDYYADFDEMLIQAKPDVVHITTPPQSHKFLACTALEAGCHVYVEKPFGMNFAEAKEIIALAEKTNKKLTIGHIYEFDPPALDMRKLIQKGVLGDPIHVESFYGYNLAGLFGSAILSNNDNWVHRLPGKLFQNNINHLLNKVTEFIPDDRPSLTAIGYRLRKKIYGDLRDDMLDELRLLIKGEESLISAYATFSSHIKPTAQFARIYGTKNTLHVDYVSRTVTFEQGPRLPSAIGRLLPAFSMGKQYFHEGCRNISRFIKSDFCFFSGMNTLISRFYDSIIHNTPLPVSYPDILRISYMMDEIFAQLSQGNKKS